ncbi:hypothetical protein [Oceanobacillus sp. 1P07AA]|uniref:hypothetical protein n=1 Tax=Oceanobacillus sp. 1P07AA TaxID=3132293 RepID=UPI0039A748F7
MNFRIFLNEKGVTLVELLAILALLGTIIALFSTAIYQGIGGKDKVTTTNSMQQNGNVIINAFREDYNQKTNGISTQDTFTLCSNVGLEHVDKVIVNNHEVTMIEGCSTEEYRIDEKLNLELVFSKGDEQLILHTLLDGKESLSLAFEVEPEDDIDKGDPDDYEPGDTHPSWDKYICDFYGNTSFKQSQMGSWNACDPTTIHEGNAWFLNNFSIHEIKLFVDYNLFADKDFTLHEKSTVNVGESALMEGGLTFTPGTMKVGKNLKVQGSTILHNNAKLEIGENALFESPLTVTNGEVITNRNLEAKKEVRIENNGVIHVGGNAHFFEKVQFNGRSNLTIDGNATFEGNLHFQEISQIVVGGDAHIKGNTGPEWGAGQMCVYGDATFDQTIYKNLKQVETDACFQPAGHHIYIVNK